MPKERVFRVEETAGQRLDRFLAERLPEASRSAIRKWIDQGLVTVGGQVQKAGHKLRAGDVVRACPPPPEPTQLLPEDIPVSVVYEDEALLVVDKPAGMVVHPGAGNRSGTLANALLHHLRRLSGAEGPRPGIVHRLDKDTSGLLVVAKSDPVHERLTRQFKSRQVEKEYLALVHGRLAPARGEIQAPVGRHPSHRVKMSTRSRKPRAARTEYETLRVFSGFSYLRVKLHTGRTHQIRVHLESIGHPVVGDALYGSASREANLPGEAGRAIRGLGRHFLHAARLAFDHPLSEKRMSFESPLPEQLADLLKRLE